MEYTALFLIGLTGSLHCLGMCGPIVLALPSQDKSPSVLFLNRILYNSGRILSYALIGFMIGFIGSKLNVIKFQDYVSIIAGAAIILFTIIPANIKNKTFFNYKYFQPINNGIRKLFKQNTRYSFLFIGVLNGFLPCGLIYVAAAAAFASASIYKGALLMAIFGLGTFPLMLLASVAAKYISKDLRSRFNKLVPVLAIVVGVIFILRGLNLGIPFISPELIKGSVHSCCTK